MAGHSKDKDFKIFTDKRYAFTEDFQLPIHWVDEFDKHKVQQLLADEDIAALQTATSYPGKLELMFIECASELGIKTAAFIDAWVNMRLRFETKNGSLCLPDEIQVIDENARQIALQEGLPEDRIVISGHPYHKYLSQWRSTLSREQFELKNGFDPSKPLVLYAPDPLTMIGGKSVCGTDEVETTQLLIQALIDEELTEEFNLVVQLHFKQNIDLISSEFDRHDISWKLWQSSSINDLLSHSDVIIGMSSNILVEAKILGTTVLRFYPNCQPQSDTLKPKGFPPPLQTGAEVMDALKNVLDL